MRKLVIVSILVLIAKGTFACTLFWANKNDQILCAKNMDWSNPDARMLFIPATEDKFGRVYFGIESTYGFTNTSGMNEKGLWYGGASLPERTDVYNTFNKPRWDYELVEKVMEECETVDEAIAVFSEYWEPHWDGHTMIADRFGHSVIIEYDENDVVFIRNNKEYQVITNFYLSDTINSRWYNCYRYHVANELLSNCSDISFSLFRDIAESTHAEGDANPTILTIIHDLKTGDIQLYNMHNFQELLTINLYGELDKGEHYVKCSEFFSKIKICNPENGSIVSSDNVKLAWNGEQDQYTIRYSKSPDFEEYDQVVISGLKQSSCNKAMMHWSFMLLMLISCLIIIIKNKNARILMVLILVLISFACDEIDVEPQFSGKTHEIILADLEPGSIYYWKVLNDNVWTEPIEPKTQSIVFSFKTM